MDVTERSNIEQRIFDALPPFPQETRLRAVFEAFEFMDKTSMRAAIARLKAKRFIEVPPGRNFVLRRTEHAQRPDDRRGGSNRGQGRKSIP